MEGHERIARLYPQGGGARRSCGSAVLLLNDIQRRLLGVLFAATGPRVAYAITALAARAMYRLLTPLRQRAEAQCRAALHDRVPPGRIPAIAAQSWVQRVWNLTDLLLADRLLHPGTYHRYGGRIPDDRRQELRDAQRRRQPTILLTAYYGSYDLLPLFLGFNGVTAAALYRAHRNTRFDTFRRRVRARGGCELVPVEQALQRLPAVLDDGGTIAIVADHHAEHRGLPATFLGLPTLALPTVGILAVRHRADVVVAGIRRIHRRFQFAIEVTDVIKPSRWDDAADPVGVITDAYLAGLEQLVLRDPTQYLWAYARWGEALARDLARQ